MQNELNLQLIVLNVTNLLLSITDQNLINWLLVFLLFDLTPEGWFTTGKTALTICSTTGSMTVTAATTAIGFQVNGVSP